MTGLPKGAAIWIPLRPAISSYSAMTLPRTGQTQFSEGRTVSTDSASTADPPGERSRSMVPAVMRSGFVMPFQRARSR